jgi:transposase
VNIDDGCVEVTFLIPTEVANILFYPDRLFSQEDVKEFRDSSVLLLKCNGCEYDFSKDETATGNVVVHVYNSLFL